MNVTIIESKLIVMSDLSSPFAGLFYYYFNKFIDIDNNIILLVKKTFKISSFVLCLSQYKLNIIISSNTDARKVADALKVKLFFSN